MTTITNTPKQKQYLFNFRHSINCNIEFVVQHFIKELDAEISKIIFSKLMHYININFKLFQQLHNKNTTAAARAEKTTTKNISKTK